MNIASFKRIAEIIAVNLAVLIAMKNPLIGASAFCPMRLEPPNVNPLVFKGLLVKYGLDVNQAAIRDDFL